MLAVNPGVRQHAEGLQELHQYLHRAYVKILGGAGDAEMRLRLKLARKRRTNISISPTSRQ
jgi:hypothetical protein